MNRVARVVLAMALFACLPCVAIAQTPPTKPAPPVKPAAPVAPGAPTGITATVPHDARAEKKSVYDEKADAHKQIEAALARAKKENRHVLIQWGANWCGWCIKLHELCASNKELARKLMYEYDFVPVDIGNWDKNFDLAEQYGVDLKANGVPYLTILDADGKVLMNHDSGSLEAKDYEFGGPGPSHDVKKVMELLTKYQAPYLSADSILADAQAQAKEENKTLLLHFGAPWCGWCKKFEAWLAQPDVEETLSKDFIEVKIDTDRTLGGQDMLTHYAASDKTGIPWFALMNAEGKVIADSTGPNGNIGCPVQDEEIAYFRDMLNKSAKTLSKEDIMKITAKLQEKDEKAAAGH